MIEKLSILLIEENQSIFDTLIKMDIEWTLTTARTVDEAINVLAQTQIDLIITELYSLEIIRSFQKAAVDVPLIATGGPQSEEFIREIIRLGAQDFLPKNELNPLHLKRVIYASIERNRLAQSLRALSFTDELTGLYNRRGFFTLLEQQISLSKRSGLGFFVLMIDLDHLKKINDTHGHPAGDQALKAIADCLRLAFRHHDIVGRIGGDEFAVIAINASEDCKELLKRNLHNKIREIAQKPYPLSVSSGAAYFSTDSKRSIDELIRIADDELYEQKKLAPIFS